jgi:rubrerythrin
MTTIEVKLYGHLTEHVSSEADLLASYRELAEAPDTPAAARYLIRMVVEDEERHHRLFHEMTAAVGNGFGWTHDSEAVPELVYGQPPRSLEEVTARFLAAEQADRKQLRALRKELRPFRDTSLWDLLVELMEYDTAKHIRVFTFLRDHVARHR